MKSIIINGILILCTFSVNSVQAHEFTNCKAEQHQFKTNVLAPVSSIPIIAKTDHVCDFRGGKMYQNSSTNQQLYVTEQQEIPTVAIVDWNKGKDILFKETGRYSGQNTIIFDDGTYVTQIH